MNKRFYYNLALLLTDNSSACHNVKEELLTTILYSLRKLRLTVLTPVLLILDIMPFVAPIVLQQVAVVFVYY